MEIYRFIVNPLEENTFVVQGLPGRCIIVDPGCYSAAEQERIKAFLKARALRPEAILLTHGHMDHIYGVADLQREFDIPVYMSPADKPVVTYFRRIGKYGLPVADTSFTTTDIAEGSSIKAGGMEFKVISTPGHTPGCVCYLEENEKVLFTGDTLFAGAIGRSDLYGGNYDDEIRSIMEKLMALDGNVAIYPGHGGSGTIGGERVGNPFLEPFNEREEIPELNEC